MTDFLIKALKGLGALLLGSCLTRAKIRGAIYYLQGVQATRRLVMTLCLATACLAALAVGLALLPLALYFYLPWTPGAKAILLLFFGIVYVAIPVIVLARLLSEKHWMKISRADKLLEKISKER